MYAKTKIYLYDDRGEKFFGDGPCQLLHEVEKTGSLRGAALSMQMAYTKALTMVRRAEQALGYPLTETVIGGQGGGGSRLTPKAKEFLHEYEEYRSACTAADERLYQQVFSKQR